MYSEGTRNIRKEILNCVDQINFFKNDIKGSLKDKMFVISIIRAVKMSGLPGWVEKPKK